MKRLSGFTLIEVLIAMAITVIAAMIAYSGLDNAVKLSETAEVEAERLQKMNRVFDILGKDFRQVIARPVRNADGDDIEPAFSLDLADQPMLKFSRAGWMNPQSSRFQRSELQRINYHFDGIRLTRYSWQMMDRYQDSVAQEVVLLDNLKAFEVKVLSDVGTVNAAGQVVTADKGEWITSWPINNLLSQGNAQTTLPIAVEITLDIDGWGKVRRVYELTAGVTL